MSLASRHESPLKPHSDSERHARIVEAAQRAFVRLGFHAATMQNVAEEAGMSAGNLYRYFPSKEALVEGLCLHDHDQRAENFLALASRTDIVEAFVTMLKDDVFGMPREKARLIVEIWAEASRNPRVAQISRDFDAATFEGLCKLVTEARSKGSVATNVNVTFVARTLMTLVAGVFKRLAVDVDFDRELEAGYAISILRALLSGAIVPAASSDLEMN